METNYAEEERYYRAQKRVKEIKGFYEHLAVFAVSNPIIIVVNLMTSPKYLFFLWGLLPWVLVIVIHGLKVFNYTPFFNKEWEKQKVKEFIEKEEQAKKTWE